MTYGKDSQEIFQLRNELKEHSHVVQDLSSKVGEINSELIKLVKEKLLDTKATCFEKS